MTLFITVFSFPFAWTIWSPWLLLTYLSSEFSVGCFDRFNNNKKYFYLNTKDYKFKKKLDKLTWLIYFCTGVIFFAHHCKDTDIAKVMILIIIDTMPPKKVWNWSLPSQVKLTTLGYRSVSVMIFLVQTANLQTNCFISIRNFPYLRITLKYFL